jgi:hypothetical protein
VALFTVKIKAKRRSRWSYAGSVALCLPLNAIWAWVAYSAGFGRALAWQVLIVFTSLQLLYFPLLYLANERQFRDHTSKALPITATTFACSFGAAVLYFIGRHEGDLVAPLAFGIVSFGLAIYIMLFLIRYEVK